VASKRYSIRGFNSDICHSAHSRNYMSYSMINTAGIILVHISTFYFFPEKLNSMPSEQDRTDICGRPFKPIFFKYLFSLSYLHHISHLFQCYCVPYRLVPRAAARPARPSIRPYFHVMKTPEHGGGKIEPTTPKLV
jgi:hypothetical protein